MKTTLVAVSALALCACDSMKPAAPAASLAPPVPVSSANNVNNPGNVLVINDATQPIPTTAVGTASVSIANTPNVNATISGTPNVSASITAIAAGVSLPVTVSGAVPVSGNVGINAPAGGLATSLVSDATGLTHVRRKASELVTLTGRADGPPGVAYLVRLNPDGSTTPSGCTPGPACTYKPSGGKVLIITDLSWQVSGMVAGLLNTVALSYLNDFTALVISPGLVDESGNGAATTSLTSGIVVPSGGGITANSGSSASRTSISIFAATLHGYLVDDQ